MTKLIFICFAGLLNSNPVLKVNYSKLSKEKIHISYDLNKKLTWKDYKLFNGKRREAAFTATEISYKVEQKDDEMNVNVTCVFDKNKSNVVSKYMNDYILNHEQRHFDLSFIYAMKFVDELKKQPTLTLDDIDIIYNKIFNLL